MRKRLLPFILILLISFSASARNLEAFLSYCTFYSPESGPYIETYLSLVGSSVEYQLNENGKFQGSIEVTYIFKQGDVIKDFKKYNILSPELEDTLNSFVNFVDQQRFQLNNGTYEFEIEIADNNSKKAPFQSTQTVKINYPNSIIKISEIELVESSEPATEVGMFTKSGYNIIPYVNNYYPEGVNKISFYAEIYNTKYVLEDQPFLVNYYIAQSESQKPLNSFRGFKRQSASKVNVIFSEFNIADLSSGNYDLVIEVRDKSNTLLADQRMFFQRNNPAIQLTMEDISNLQIANSFVAQYTNIDTLAEYIRSIRPISSELERSFVDHQLKEADLHLMQQFFFTFWKNRNALDPAREWALYQHELKKVNIAYSTSIKKGYETDRGRVYLQYGPPNTIVERKSEPASYPYEIWHYYKMSVRSDARFVFYDNDLSTNDYVLLHSNVRGEVNDYRWQARLQKRTGMPTNLDEGGTESQFGSPTDNLFNDPR